MKISIFGSLARPARGRPKKSDALQVDVGQPPWLPVSKQAAQRRKKQIKQLRRSLLKLPSFRRLSEPDRSSLIKSALHAQNVWVMSHKAGWLYHNPEKPRGRKHKTADTRLMLDCVTAWRDYGTGSGLYSPSKSFWHNKCLGTSGTVTNFPIPAQIARVIWENCGYEISDSKLAGIIDNAMKS